MTSHGDDALDLSVQQRPVVINPADCDPATIAINVHLKNLATGDALRRTLGTAYQQVAQQLCASPDTLQSVTRCWMASIDGEVVGQVSAIAHSEYSARRRASAQLIWRASRIAGIRIHVDSLRRWLARSQLGPWASDQLYIESLAVTESAQRQGIGARLLSHAQAIAREQSCRALSLNALTTNVAAISLYDANGFHVVSRRGHRVQLLKPLA